MFKWTARLRLWIFKREQRLEMRRVVRGVERDLRAAGITLQLKK